MATPPYSGLPRQGTTSGRARAPDPLCPVTSGKVSRTIRVRAAISGGTRVALVRGMATKRMRVAMAGIGLALAFTGCTSHGAYLSTGQTQLGQSPHQVGPVTVVIRPQPEVEMICRLRSPHRAPDGRIHGCYVPADRMIVSTADPYVLMHEFKHYFEGAWHK